MNIRDTLARKFNKKINETLNFFYTHANPGRKRLLLDHDGLERGWSKVYMQQLERFQPRTHRFFRIMVPWYVSKISSNFSNFPLLASWKSLVVVFIFVPLFFDGDSASTAPSSSSSEEELVSRAGSRTCPLHRANFPEFKFGQNTNERVVWVKFSIIIFA